MNSRKVFYKNTISLYLMNVVKLIFPLLTLPYLTRILTTEVYGVVTYVKAMIVYVQLIIDFGFLLSATKDIVYADGDVNKIGKITGDVLAEKMILSGVATFIYAILMFLVPVMKEHIIFSSIYLFATISTIFIFDFMFRGLEKMHLVAFPYIVSKTISTGMTFMIVKGDNDILFIPIFELLGNIVAAIISMLFLKKLDIKISFSKLDKWISDLKESCVYFISNFATTIFGALTTVVAGLYLKMDSIAYWGICMQILSAAKALYNPIINSLYPYMIRKKDIRCVKKINFIMIVPMSIGCCAVLFRAERLMSIIGGINYAEAGYILKLLLPAFVFSFYSMIYGWPVLGAVGKIKETTTTTIVASIIQIMGIGILIVSNNFCLFGLAICCSISETLLLVFRYVIYLRNKNFFIKGEK